MDYPDPRVAAFYAVVWISVGMEEVDKMHKAVRGRRAGGRIFPTDVSGNVRGMHLRHRDGHVFRIGRGFEPKK
jgi:hypothetical protein